MPVSAVPAPTPIKFTLRLDDEIINVPKDEQALACYRTFVNIAKHNQGYPFSELRIQILNDNLLTYLSNRIVNYVTESYLTYNAFSSDHLLIVLNEFAQSMQNLNINLYTALAINVDKQRIAMHFHFNGLIHKQELVKRYELRWEFAKGGCMSDRHLVDAFDGENMAVRSFLMQYSCDKSLTVHAMHKHMERSGWSHTNPGWVYTAQGEHLTKGLAQQWIRHLMALESIVPTIINKEAT